MKLIWFSICELFPTSFVSWVMFLSLVRFGKQNFSNSSSLLLTFGVIVQWAQCFQSVVDSFNYCFVFVTSVLVNDLRCSRIVQVNYFTYRSVIVERAIVNFSVVISIVMYDFVAYRKTFLDQFLFTWNLLNILSFLKKFTNVGSGWVIGYFWHSICWKLFCKG